MFYQHTSALLAAFCLLLAAPAAECRAASTTFTYQGHLESSDVAATGVYDFAFSLYDAATEGDKVGTDVTVNSITVTDGLFNAPLDFGPVFDGSQLWLQISLRPEGTTAYTTLTPRQPISQAPQAIHASTAGAANSANTAANGVPAGFSILGNSETPPPGFTWTGRVMGKILERWERLADSPGSISNAVATALAGKVYFSNAVNNLFVYDPTDDSWAELASIPNSAVLDASLVTLNGKIYHGGFDIDQFATITNVYDPSIDSWTSLPNPIDQYMFKACSLNGELYILGSSFMSSYDPETQIWTTREASPIAGDFAPVEGPNGKMYCFGFNGTAYVYDSTLDDSGTGSAWTQLTSMPIARRYFDATYLDGKIYCMGGENTDRNDIYDIATDTWTTGAPVASGNHSMATAEIGGHIYVKRSGSSRLFYRYTPAAPGYYVHVKE